VLLDPYQLIANIKYTEIGDLSCQRVHLLSYTGACWVFGRKKPQTLQSTMTIKGSSLYLFESLSGTALVGCMPSKIRHPINLQKGLGVTMYKLDLMLTVWEKCIRICSK
jgi:hypothetical protein